LQDHTGWVKETEEMEVGMVETEEMEVGMVEVEMVETEEMEVWVLEKRAKSAQTHCRVASGL
jgi:hypothetical protein